jgi:hypothetical protein
MSDSLEQQQHQPQPRLGVVTIHDACPAFSKKIFESADELERLNIKFNIALIPFFNEKEDLPRFPEFVDKIKSYKIKIFAQFAHKCSQIKNVGSK